MWIFSLNKLGFNVRAITTSVAQGGRTLRIDLTPKTIYFLPEFLMLEKTFDLMLPFVLVFCNR
jgi:hypothetical protein